MTPGFTSRWRRLHRRASIARSLTVLLIATGLASGCAEEGAAERTPPADSPVLLEPSQAYVTFTNRAGLPLIDIRISIVPYGPTEFTRVVTRVENTARRQIPVNEFRSRDGTVFNPRVTRAKAVRLTAKDLNGKAYEAEVPWN
jgi:hypothetical protein